MTTARDRISAITHAVGVPNSSVVRLTPPEGIEWCMLIQQEDELKLVLWLSLTASGNRLMLRNECERPRRTGCMSEWDVTYWDDAEIIKHLYQTLTGHPVPYRRMPKIVTKMETKLV